MGKIWRAFVLSAFALLLEGVKPSCGLDLACALEDQRWMNDSEALSETCSSLCSAVEEDESFTDSKENVGLAFGLVVAAGMSTSVGAALVFFDRFVTKRNPLMLAASLGFSAGVMLYVSFVEILVKSVDAFESCDCLWEHEDPRAPAKVMAAVTFFSGVVVFFLMSFLVHSIKPNFLIRTSRGKKKGVQQQTSIELNSTTATRENTSEQLELEDQARTPRVPHGEEKREEGKEKVDTVHSADSPQQIRVEVCACDHGEESEAQVIDLDEMTEAEREKALNKMGLMTALAIGLHNFPEGLATFVGTLADPSVGLGLAIAIAIHNIPEGLCVSIPIFYATGSRWKGFFIASVSGMAEIVGAALGYAFLMAIFTDAAYAVLFGIVAGMMVAIVVSELLPTAQRYDPHGKVTLKAFFFGMMVMALSLVLFLL